MIGPKEKTTRTGKPALRAVVVLPLLALTACAGSQRFAAPQPSSAPYGQSALPSVPPVTSAPVTSEPLPPPGGYPPGQGNYPTQGGYPPQSGYPVAGAPAGEGALPPPQQQDPFFNPQGGAAPTQPGAVDGGAPPLRSGGQTANLGTAPAAPRMTRDSVVGGWTAREATGGSCRVQLSSAPALDLYRATASGCSNRDLQRVNAWDYRDGEVYLYQQGGTVVARLRAGGSSMDGAITKSGAGLSLSR